MRNAGRLLSFPHLLAYLLAGSVACSRGGADSPSDLSAGLPDLQAGRDLGSADLGTAPDLAGCPARQVWLEGACVRCDIVLPTDTASLADALRLAPSPGLLCLGPGTYTGNLTLRPHVSIVGSGPSTLIDGGLSIAKLADADPTPTSLADVRIQYKYSGGLHPCPPENLGCSQSVDNRGKTTALHISRVLFQGGPDDSTYCGVLEFAQGDVDIAVRDSTCTSSRGIRFSNQTESKRTRIRFVIERNRFEPVPGGSDSIYDPVEFLPFGAGPTGGTPLEAGSTITAVIQNNAFVRTSYEGIYLTQAVVLQAADDAGSFIDIRYNTFVSSDGQNAIWNNSITGHGPKLSITNNLFFASAQPLRGLAPAVDKGNLAIAKDQSPFADLAKGDLRLNKDTPPVDAADESFAIGEDIVGTRRPVNGHGFGRPLPDVGAYEYVPPGAPPALRRLGR